MISVRPVHCMLPQRVPYSDATNSRMRPLSGLRKCVRLVRPRRWQFRNARHWLSFSGTKICLPGGLTEKRSIARGKTPKMSDADVHSDFRHTQPILTRGDQHPPGFIQAQCPDEFERTYPKLGPKGILQLPAAYPDFLAKPNDWDFFTDVSANEIFGRSGLAEMSACGAGCPGQKTRRDRLSVSKRS